MRLAAATVGIGLCPGLNRDRNKLPVSDTTFGDHVLGKVPNVVHRTALHRNLEVRLGKGGRKSGSGGISERPIRSSAARRASLSVAISTRMLYGTR